MQFKKLAGMAGAGLMTALTIATPVLGATVTSVGNIGDMVTVTDSTVSFPMFVVGANAKTEDVAGAINVAVNLAANAKTTESVSTTAGSEISVAGGKKIATPGNELAPWTAIQSVKSVLTSTDLTSLADQTYQTSTGGSFQYKQYLYLSGDTTQTTYNKVVFEKPTSENNPIVNFKATANQNVTTYKLAFSTPVALGSTVDSNAELQAILQGTAINIMGKDFVITDCASDATDVISSITIVGGKNTVTVTTGEDKTVTINDKDYIVHVSGVAIQTVGGTNTYTAVGDVNGEAFELTAGNTKTLTDGTLIAAVKVIQGKTGEADFVKLAVGADKIKLAKSGTVTKGTKTVSELTSEFSATAAGGWSWMKISYKPSSDMFVKAGEQIVDPFSETFNIKFEGITPALDDETDRQTINLDPSSYNMMLSYKNAAGDLEKFYSAYYNSTGSNYQWTASGVASTLNDDGFRNLTIDEASNISAIEGDYLVLNKAGFSRVLQFTSFTPASSELVFTDMNGNSITSSNTSGVDGTLIVDGNSFIYRIGGGGTGLAASTKKCIKMDLNGDGYIAGVASGAVETIPGTEYSFLIPKLITSGQGGMYFYNGNKTVSLLEATTNVYPQIGIGGIRLSNTSNVITVSTYTAANTWTDESTTITITLPTVAGAMYNATYTTKYIDYVVNCGNRTGAASALVCNVGIGTSAALMQTSPGFVLVEEALQGTETHNWVFMPVAWDSTNSRIYVTTPVTDDASLTTGSDTAGTGWNQNLLGTQEYQGMTTYGTHITYYTTTGGGQGKISYPDSFTYGNLYVMTPEGTITTATTEEGAVSTDKVLAITSDVVMLDSEVTDTSAYDFVLVGGPCVNSLVADLATAGKFDYTCASWPAENMGIIKVVSGAFADGKTALVIAGTRAADTDLAARVVQDGTKLAGKTADSVTVTGESFASVVVA